MVQVMIKHGVSVGMEGDRDICTVAKEKGGLVEYQGSFVSQIIQRVSTAESIE
jgi:hypothetical protein